MKRLFKLMIIAVAGALSIISCQEKPANEIEKKPVVTDQMYSVTVNTETGEVGFRFTESSLNPCWTISDPNKSKETVYDREFTRTYQLPGIYTCKLVAFGKGGESDPIEFIFNPLGEDVDETLSPTENILISQTWKPYGLIYYGGSEEDESYWDYVAKLPKMAADDRLTFHKDGKFELNFGESTEIFNDMGKDSVHPDEIILTGEEKWEYLKEGDAEYIQFSNGGFPAMLADNDGINGKYEIRNVSTNKFELHYYQAAQEQSLCFVYVSENYVDEPSDSDMTKEAVAEYLSGKTFNVAAYGWCGYGDDEWEYFKDPVPETTLEDLITFNADGTLTIDLGEDLQIYHDGGWREGEEWTITGEETWAVVSDEEGVYIKFDNGGFPLMLAGTKEEGPDYNHGLNGKWTVASIDEGDGSVRVEIYESYAGQWFTVFLAPVE